MPITSVQQYIDIIKPIASKGVVLSLDEARQLIKLISNLFKMHLENNNKGEAAIRALRTKFRDAGRRSAPWKPTSSRVPGRPQDGNDGNRINRWLLPVDHKFYADEITATLVEVKYYLQALSMLNAPPLPNNSLIHDFDWLLSHPLIPSAYKDPIQLIEIDLDEVLEDARIIQSGHLHPLDRGGRHEPNNTFLMLYRSNQLQGNLTVDELIDLMESIVQKHRTR